MGTEIVEQPNQLQLVVRVRIKPQLDYVATLAHLDQSEILPADLLIVDGRA
jgi:hypothetical protein